jgi:hypothetical protein
MNCLECKATLFPENPEVGFTDFKSKRYYPPICQGCSNAYQKEDAEVRERVLNLEEISAQPNRIPRRYYDEFQQIHDEIAYLRNKIYELSAESVKKPVLAEGVRL